MKRQSKIMSIVVLAVCVLGLTIGFAAFSNTLTIKSSATVKPNESDFNVEFSTSADSVTYGVVNAMFATDLASGTATVKEGSDTIEDLSVSFTYSNNSPVFIFYIHNTGKYTAYLNEIEVENIAGESVFQKCTPKTSESNPLVDAACDNINMNIFGGEVTDPENYYGGDLLINGGRLNSEETPIPQIAPGEVYMLAIEIPYGMSCSDEEPCLSDEEFTVEFGDIDFLFESVAAGEYIVAK